MKLCVVTCTGRRWESFALCRRWVERQTVRPDRWIVTCDTGEAAPPLPDYASFHQVGAIQPGFDLEPPTKKVAKHNRHKAASWALHEALGHVPADHAVVIMEDDDWYAPEHCERILDEINRGAPGAFGWECWRWNLPAEKMFVDSYTKPVEGVLGFAPSELTRFRDSLRKTERAVSGYIAYAGFSSVGIKGFGDGLVGRAGATFKHSRAWVNQHGEVYKPDPGLRMFRRLLGEDAEGYIRLLKP